MNMKKWLILAATLTLTLATAGTVTAFALAGDGGSKSADDDNTAGEVTDGDPTYDERILDVGGGHGDGKAVWLSIRPDGGPSGTETRAGRRLRRLPGAW